MSLFENELYHWRETYFVLFEEKQRPTAEAMKAALLELGERYEIAEIRIDESERFESVTIYSPTDFAAMDITYCGGEDALESVAQLREDMRDKPLTAVEKGKLKRLASCDARLDIYHFEQLSVEDDDDEILDPGALLIVLERVAKLCHGVGVDPQSGELM
ncbi:hypothetical protein [Lignipirellula cremea]|uniref:Uncharacterized protein n=1 Tax=Lignipirellula cremea TaxID=2528010 RepID=A0A518DSH0_9BACT|nr:hypothetical protein [Lignipirellula cremea]QDU94774.1 hypothetical protein Pla8534_25810 [Lignipirellula cremea]